MRDDVGGLNLRRHGNSDVNVIFDASDLVNKDFGRFEHFFAEEFI